jgi:hypothetical protein
MLILPYLTGIWKSYKKFLREECTMTNFIKKIIGGSSSKGQGDCCGVEIREVESEYKKDTSDSCCGTETSESCCDTDPKEENSSSCCR